MFRSLKLKSTYSTYEDDIGATFYTPVLKCCRQYDRATAYFSAKALSSYGQGLEYFANKGYKYRLIVSTEISEDDYNQISAGYELRDQLRKSLLNKLNEDLDLIDQSNLSNLSYLIAKGTIDIKMAFTKHGIFHDKFGIMHDENENIICFRGSNNETHAAFHSNYESFDITCSWQASDFDYSKIVKSIDIFDKLWNNKTDNIIVSEIDTIIYDKILSFNKGKIIYEPILLEKNCVILDYDQCLKLYIRTSPPVITNYSRVYKLTLNRYLDKKRSSEDNLIFDLNLKYPIFKKIIAAVKKDSQNKGYIFHTTKRLLQYIGEKELYIKERAKIGLAIKQQNDDISGKFLEYKSIVDKEMVRSLREKQMWDSFYMFTMKKASNFSVPGSGKTSSVLGVFAFLQYKNIVDKIVMIGPKNSFGSWIDEFRNCFGYKKSLKLFNIHDYTSTEKKRAILYETYDKNLLLFNYESLKSIRNELSQIIDNKTLLVFDEVHKVKAIQGERADNALFISKNANYTIAMTGTPIPNSYADIRNILNILYPNEYDDFFGFTESQLKNPAGNDIVDINSKLQPFFCRTTKHQLLVPESNEDIFIKTKSEDIENQIFNILLMKYAKNKLALIIRLLQLESNPKMLLKAINEGGEDFSDILYTLGEVEDVEYKNYSEDIVSLINSIDKTKKFETCIEQASTIVNDNKSCIIWCVFVDSILRIEQELCKKGIKVRCIYGNTNSDERDEILKKFRNKEIDILITNPHTLAESVSLHSVCHDAIYFEYSYNLVHLLQSKDRIHRLGLPKNQYTQYYYLQNFFTNIDEQPYSLDEKIYERLMEKEQVMLDAIENNTLEPITTTQNDIDLIFNNLMR